jgi:putative chitinase
MANRVVYGNAWSSNGWPMVDEGSCTWVTVPGTNPQVTLQIQNGQPLQLLRAFAADFNAEVEPLRDPDSACWTEDNDVDDSNHLSGTAMDLNWDSHPFEVPDAGFDAAKRAKVRELLDWYEGMIFWGNDWYDPKDAMHFQLASLANGGNINTYGNPAVDDFIRRKIRADGFSTRRGAQPAPDLVAILADAMGGAVQYDRYAQLLPAVQQCLDLCGCNTVLRRAMWFAQIGHESGGLRWMEEIADGSAYEGRADLGNTQPGDGKRFKGRGPIQVTGRSNYTNLSRWAFDHGLVPSPTFFVDDPAQLSSDAYGFLGVVWYWTVARPQINSLCDAGDLDGVTRAINGGLNGIDDRRNRYNHALAMGDALLEITTTGDDFMSALSADEQREMLDLLRWLAAPGTGELRKRFPSRSPLRHLGEGAVDTAAGMLLNDDGNDHLQLVIDLARVGDPGALSLLREVASADPLEYPDRQDDAKLAKRILASLNADPAAQAATTIPTVIPPATAPAEPVPPAAPAPEPSTPAPQPEPSTPSGPFHPTGPFAPVEPTTPAKPDAVTCALTGGNCVLVAAPTPDGKCALGGGACSVAQIGGRK